MPADVMSRAERLRHLLAALEQRARGNAAPINREGFGIIADVVREALAEAEVAR